MESILAIDIGGTKVDVGLVTFGGHIISRDRILTLEASEGSLYKRILEIAHKELAKADTPPRAIGIGCGEIFRCAKKLKMTWEFKLL